MALKEKDFMAYTIVFYFIFLAIGVTNFFFPWDFVSAPSCRRLRFQLRFCSGLGMFFFCFLCLHAIYSKYILHTPLKTKNVKNKNKVKFHVKLRKTRMGKSQRNATQLMPRVCMCVWHKHRRSNPFDWITRLQAFKKFLFQRRLFRLEDSTCLRVMRFRETSSLRLVSKANRNICIHSSVITLGQVASSWLHIRFKNCQIDGLSSLAILGWWCYFNRLLAAL